MSTDAQRINGFVALYSINLLGRDVWFGFKEIDDRLFKELAKLTDKGYKRFKKEKLVG